MRTNASFSRLTLAPKEIMTYGGKRPHRKYTKAAAIRVRSTEAPHSLYSRALWECQGGDILCSFVEDEGFRHSRFAKATICATSRIMPSTVKVFDHRIGKQTVRHTTVGRVRDVKVIERRRCSARRLRLRLLLPKAPLRSQR